MRLLGLALEGSSACGIAAQLIGQELEGYTATQL